MKNQYTEIEKDGVKTFKIEGNDDYIISKCHQIIDQLKPSTKRDEVANKWLESKHYPKVKEFEQKIQNDKKHRTRAISQLIGVQGLSDEDKYTGIKEDADGTTRYQLRYECPECNEKGKHFIPEHTPFVNCHKCNHEMKVNKVETDYHVQQDTFKNYYYAGNYEPKLY